jgi:hypothetical protein
MMKIQIRFHFRRHFADFLSPAADMLIAASVAAMRRWFTMARAAAASDTLTLRFLLFIFFFRRFDVMSSLSARNRDS